MHIVLYSLYIVGLLTRAIYNQDLMIFKNNNKHILNAILADDATLMRVED